MPRRFPLSTLVLRAQQRADMEGQGFIASDEWKAILSSAYAELYSCVASTGLRYFETTENLTSDGTAYLQEPSSHLSTVGLDYIDTAGNRRELVELMAQERNALGTAQGGQARAYAFVDDRIVLYPTPPAGQTYQLLYIPQPPDLATLQDADLVDVVTPDGEAFLLWGAAVVALGKEESDTSLARAEREAARARVYEWAVLRALHNARRRIVDDEVLVRDPGDWR